MTKKDKLIARVARKPVPNDIRFAELKSLLESLGYVQSNKGRTSGSRIIFIDAEKNIIQLHKSHGSDPVKEKALTYVVEHLRERGHIGE